MIVVESDVDDVIVVESDVDDLEVVEKTPEATAVWWTGEFDVLDGVLFMRRITGQSARYFLKFGAHMFPGIPRLVCKVGMLLTNKLHRVVDLYHPCIL